VYREVRKCLECDFRQEKNDLNDVKKVQAIFYQNVICELDGLDEGCDATARRVSSNCSAKQGVESEYDGRRSRCQNPIFSQEWLNALMLPFYTLPKYLITQSQGTQILSTYLATMA
jgi:hypothetical protein